MKQATGVGALVLGLSMSMVSTAHATQVQTSDNVTTASTSASSDHQRGKKCATRREYKRVKVKGTRKQRSSRREVRRIMDFKGRRDSFVRSGGHKWESRKYRHCRTKGRYGGKNKHVYVKYRDNVAYAKVGKP